MVEGSVYTHLRGTVVSTDREGRKGALTRRGPHPRPESRTLSRKLRGRVYTARSRVWWLFRREGRVYPRGPLRGRPSPPPGLSLVPRDGGRPLPQLRPNFEGGVVAGPEVLRMVSGEQRAPPSPALPRKLRGGGRTAGSVRSGIEFSPFSRGAGERGRGRGGPVRTQPDPFRRTLISRPHPTSPRVFWGRWASNASPEGARGRQDAVEALSTSPFPHAVCGGRAGDGGACPSDETLPLRYFRTFALAHFPLNTSAPISVSTL
jgi:hypothetical protein